MKDESTSRLTVDGLRNARTTVIRPEIYALAHGVNALGDLQMGLCLWDSLGVEQAGTLAQPSIPNPAKHIRIPTITNTEHWRVHSKSSVIRNFADRLSADLVAGHAKIQLAGFAFIRPRQGPAQKNQSIISRSLKGEWLWGIGILEGIEYEWVKRQFPA
ncbi:hypothetical protein CDAR_427121 [Caerostris darwini]|uniref:Uncharacterized protein n=1 Tax=Caerostris darwini TaxID=1538125 RepID=A0AAV4Q8P1_9ARAC|nr:hypothetical protein CDAR_427121 [Caerostris darwini]